MSFLTEVSQTLCLSNSSQASALFFGRGGGGGAGGALQLLIPTYVFGYYIRCLGNGFFSLSYKLGSAIVFFIVRYKDHGSDLFASKLFKMLAYADCR